MPIRTTRSGLVGALLLSLLLAAAQAAPSTSGRRAPPYTLGEHSRKLLEASRVPVHPHQSEFELFNCIQLGLVNSTLTAIGFRRIRVWVQNVADHPLEVSLSQGVVVESPDAKLQPLVITSRRIVRINSGEEETFSMDAFSLTPLKRVPSGQLVVTPYLLPPQVSDPQMATQLRVWNGIANGRAVQIKKLLRSKDALWRTLTEQARPSGIRTLVTASAIAVAFLAWADGRTTPVPASQGGTALQRLRKAGPDATTVIGCAAVWYACAKALAEPTRAIVATTFSFANVCAEGGLGVPMFTALLAVVLLLGAHYPRLPYYLNLVVVQVITAAVMMYAVSVEDRVLAGAVVLAVLFLLVRLPATLTVLLTLPVRGSAPKAVFWVSALLHVAIYTLYAIPLALFSLHAAVQLQFIAPVQGIPVAFGSSSLLDYLATDPFAPDVHLQPDLWPAVIQVFASAVAILVPANVGLAVLLGVCKSSNPKAKSA